MLGLDRKGHLGVGADADCTIVDLATRTVKATIAGGAPIMLDGVVVGSGGTVVTTARGERTVRQSGLPVEVVDLARSGLYAPERMATRLTWSALRPRDACTGRTLTMALQDRDPRRAART